jgi:hypothetical protein
VFQLLLPSFASVADARAEAESMRSVSSHVEAYGDPTCARVHPADCVVCRILGTSVTTAASPALHVAVARFINAGPVHAERQLRGARAPGDPPQRAPPIPA